MAEEEWRIVELREDYYRDSIGKVIFLIIAICIAIAALAGLSIYLYLDKPPPVLFKTDDEWRVQPAVPLNQPYLSTPDLLQWTSDTIRKVLVYDFVNYNDQLKANTPYFTQNGWGVFLNQLNIYANYNNVQMNKLFVNANPAGAPFILQQGLLSGRYAWWVQMPVDVSYVSYNRVTKQTLTLQLLIVRVSTLNNLSGVGIDNVIVAKAAATDNQLLGNG